MNSDWAAENLRTIRTLMERSTVYRRALAPIMLASGTLGLLAGIAGLLLPVTDMPGFGLYWFAVALAALATAFLLARRQALKDREPFWSPPTRRVSQALLPPLTAGFASALSVTLAADSDLIGFFAVLCVMFYGCAVHAAGFFMPRGMKLLGWVFIAASAAGMFGLFLLEPEFESAGGHLTMAFFFGLVHLVYGAYLLVTGKRGQST